MKQQKSKFDQKILITEASYHIYASRWPAINVQEALILQRDHARHLSVEILQLQNISLENPIMWHYLRDSKFSRFDTIPEFERHTDRQTDRHITTAYTALSIASRGKNRPYCTAHQL